MGGHCSSTLWKHINTLNAQCTWSVFRKDLSSIISKFTYVNLELASKQDNDLLITCQVVLGSGLWLPSVWAASGIKLVVHKNQCLFDSPWLLMNYFIKTGGVSNICASHVRVQSKLFWPFCQQNLNIGIPSACRDVPNQLLTQSVCVVWVCLMPGVLHRHYTGTLRLDLCDKDKNCSLSRCSLGA